MMKRFLCKLGYHKLKQIGFGYLRFREFPNVIEMFTRKECDYIRNTYSNLFGSPRPDDWDINKTYLELFGKFYISR